MRLLYKEARRTKWRARWWEKSFLQHAVNHDFQLVLLQCWQTHCVAYGSLSIINWVWVLVKLFLASRKASGNSSVEEILFTTCLFIVMNYEVEVSIGLVRPSVSPPNTKRPWPQLWPNSFKVPIRLMIRNFESIDDERKCIGIESFSGLFHIFLLDSIMAF